MVDIEDPTNEQLVTLTAEDIAGIELVETGDESGADDGEEPSGGEAAVESS